MTKCRYCGNKTNGNMYCSTTCSNTFCAQKRGQQLVNDVMANPRGVLDAIPVKPRHDPTRLDELTQRIEERYFLFNEELPQKLLVQFNPEEAKILNYVIQKLNLPKKRAIIMAIIDLYKRIRELEKNNLAQPQTIMINHQEPIPTA